MKDLKIKYYPVTPAAMDGTNNNARILLDEFPMWQQEKPSKLNTIHFLHTVKRQDRFDELQIQLQKQGITDVKYIIGEEFKHYPKKGICRGHKKIVQYAKDNKMSRVVIAENDIVFLGEQAGAWQYFLDNIPNDYDLYTALCYVGDIKDNRVVSQASGITSLYIVHERFYDFFLSIEDNSHIDREVSKYWDQYKIMVSPCFTVIQSGSYSDNLRTKVRQDYSPLLKGRKLFRS